MMGTRMKPLLILALIGSCATAQTDTSKLIALGVETVLKDLQSVPQREKDEIIGVTAETLSKHLTFRPDGTVSSICTSLGRQHVEWKRLVVNHLISQPVTDADRLNGITDRYLVSFSCDGHRTFNSKTSRWSEWKSVGYTLFPAGVTCERRQGKWLIPGDSFKAFSPGPGPSVTASKTPSSVRELPPGMSRTQ